MRIFMQAVRFAIATVVFSTRATVARQRPPFQRGLALVATGRTTTTASRPSTFLKATTQIRGGSTTVTKEARRDSSSSSSGSNQTAEVEFQATITTEANTEAPPEFETLDKPAPGSPFHYAFPVHDLDVAKEFYGNTLGCVEGRSSEKWQDYSLHGHQIVCHWVGNDYRCQDYYNPVDGDEVPVPHAGLALTVKQFHALAQRLKDAGVEFIVEPHLRFGGSPGEQWTMFFKDPSGNNLEFKAMTKINNLFTKYNAVYRINEE